MLKLKYRIANLKDLDSIQKIHDESSLTSTSHYSQEEVVLMTECNDRRKTEENILNDDYSTIVIEYNDKIIAYATFELKKRWLWAIFVKPNLGHKGVGTFIINTIINIFKNNSLKKISLYSRKSSINFYKAFGFVEKEDYDWIIDKTPIKLKLMELKL